MVCRGSVALRRLQNSIFSPITFSPILLALLTLPGVGFGAGAIATPLLPTPARVAQATPAPNSFLVSRVLRTASRDLGIPRRQLFIQRYSQETWTDSCLGLGGPAESCALMLVEGWQLEVSHGEQSWFYRTDATGQVMRQIDRADVLPPSVRDRLIEAAAQQLNRPASELGVLAAEPRIWNGCLGITTSPDQVCTEIALLGWRAVVQQGEATQTAPTWVFHLNGDGSDVRLNPIASPPSAPNPPDCLEPGDWQLIDPAPMQE